MGIILGEADGYDVAMCIPDDLSALPPVVASIPLVVVSVDIKRHSPGMVAHMLRDIRALSDLESQHIFLTFDGYDDDPREIYCISEVRAWSMFFVNRENDALGCLADERKCQESDAPAALRTTSLDAIGRAKLCVLAGYGEMRKKNDGTGGHWLVLDSSGLMILASIVPMRSSSRRTETN